MSAGPENDDLVEDREQYARRMHHRQIRRWTILTILLLILGAATIRIGIPVARHIRSQWLLQACGFIVDWQLDDENWTRGGVTSVSFGNRGWQNQPHDAELTALEWLFNLDSLILAECPVSEAGLAPLHDLVQLRELNLSRLRWCQFDAGPEGMSDACLVPLQGLTSLEVLSLSGNHISDQGLVTVGQLTGLESLDLDLTDVSDAGLVHLLSLRNLKTLKLGGSQVTPMGVKKLQAALPGVEINLEVDPRLEQVVRNRRDGRQ
jgi:hypothetical protein